MIFELQNIDWTVWRLFTAGVFIRLAVVLFSCEMKDGITGFSSCVLNFGKDSSGIWKLLRDFALLGSLTAG